MAMIMVPFHPAAQSGAMPGARFFGNAFAALLKGADQAVQAIFHAAPVVREPQTAGELIEWAQAYEKSQPSYAADLRAAARAVQMRDDAASAGAR
ncbi:hypothetical protein C7444_11739 [Sphaerotilus hippei]|uniref:Uncharacterized protein n=2 Tax=Sphaerotilus hippei TaxID=744406 RepID=A0A318H492_9BURK|nr:hypothetical protein C7444_11739 [Sphaerotilus hippei]